MPAKKPIEERFHKKYHKLTPDKCWLWTAHISEGGYGRILHNGKFALAHRVSWEIHNGPIPDDMQVCHKCDVPACVNPNHLFLGTQKDNMRDASEKGRLKTKATKDRAEEKIMELFGRARNKHESIGWDMLGYDTNKGDC